jgi:hypothetical protein
MSIATIMGHLKESETDLSYRSLTNLNNQRVSPHELARECHKLGWRCLLVPDRVYIAKTKAGFHKFRKVHPEWSDSEL